MVQPQGLNHSAAHVVVLDLLLLADTALAARSVDDEYKNALEACLRYILYMVYVAPYTLYFILYTLYFVLCALYFILHQKILVLRTQRPGVSSPFRSGSLSRVRAGVNAIFNHSAMQLPSLRRSHQDCSSPSRARARRCSKKSRCSSSIGADSTS